MVAHLHAAGAPAAPGEIGVTPVHLRDSILKARFLRSRYTVLDLLDELGMLREAVAATVPGGTSRREAE
jgi:glycerol-1-phosphate dehydrogenase [NAD(P)+]